VRHRNWWVAHLCRVPSLRAFRRVGFHGRVPLGKKTSRFILCFIPPIAEIEIRRSLRSARVLLSDVRRRKRLSGAFLGKQSRRKNESAPDSSSHGTPVEQPSPEVCSPPIYVMICAWGMARMGYCGNVWHPCHDISVLDLYGAVARRSTSPVLTSREVF
jgi:hypothetical protein